MKTKILAAILAFAANTAFASPIVNGNFATGTLDSWTTAGAAGVGNNGVYNFADLYSGLGQGVYSTISQMLFLQAGDVLTGSANFIANDYYPYNDNAFVSIGGINLFAASVATVGNYGSTGLVSFTYTALTAGEYLLTAGVANQGDNGFNSELQVSNFAVASNVPEPASLALMGLGLLGVGALRRKSKA